MSYPNPKRKPVDEEERDEDLEPELQPKGKRVALAAKPGADGGDEDDLEFDEPKPRLKESKSLPKTRSASKREAEEAGGDEDDDSFTRDQYIALVLKSRTDRRKVATQRRVVAVAPNVTAKLAAAAAALAGGAGGDNQSTLAIGLLEGGRFAVYSQKGTPDADAALAAINDEFTDRVRTAADVVVIPTFGVKQGKTGKHAEIAIWSAYAESDTPLMQVGASQPCCVDCTGFLNTNGVAHSESDPEDHIGRKYWWDPELDCILSDNTTKFPKITPASYITFRK